MILDYLHAQMVEYVMAGDGRASCFESIIEAVKDVDLGRACGIVVMNGLPDEIGHRIIDAFGGVIT